MLDISIPPGVCSNQDLERGLGNVFTSKMPEMWQGHLVRLWPACISGYAWSSKIGAMSGSCQ
ncbi:MAG: hypothetical protein RJB59_750 [Actinomycetota bacterium]